MTKELFLGTYIPIILNQFGALMTQNLAYIRNLCATALSYIGNTPQMPCAVHLRYVGKEKQDAYGQTVTEIHKNLSITACCFHDMINCIDKNISLEKNFSYNLKYNDFTTILNRDYSAHPLFKPILNIATEVQNCLRSNEPIDTTENDLKSVQNPQKTISDLLKVCTQYLNHLGGRDIQAAFQKHPKMNTKGYIWRDKYCRIYQLVRDLECESLTHEKKLYDFMKHFEESKDFFKPHRNNALVRFFEAILHILSLGLVTKIRRNDFAFWKSHGEVFSTQVKEIQLKNTDGLKKD